MRERMLIGWCRLALVVLTLGLGACTAAPERAPVAQVEAEGVIVCPPPTARCELSGAVLADGRILLVNDRAIAGKASDAILALAPRPLTPRLAAQFLSGAPTLPAEKFEAIAVTLDGQQVFATTAFDRLDLATSALDRFNVLLTWPATRPQVARVLGGAPDKPLVSLELRRQLQAALASPSEPGGPAYFKVEGLAALPDRLLIGVREVGRTYKDFRFTLTILSLPWRMRAGLPELAGAPRVIWRLDPAALPALPRAPVALSDLAYDAPRDRFWLLTSYERDDEGPASVAGYLWMLDRAGLERGARPVLVHGPDGAPLMFSHKPEALAVLADGRLLVVHDDDRRATPVPDAGASGGARPRRQTEAYYQVISVSQRP